MFGMGGSSADATSAPVLPPRTLPLSLCAPGTALDQAGGGRTRPILPLNLPLTSTTSLTDLHSPLPNLATAQNPLSMTTFFPSTGDAQPSISASST